MRRVPRLAAACSTVLCVGLTGAAGVLATPAQAAARPGYVAVVIQGAGSACVKWRSGITGDDVLNKVTTVHYRRDGLIDQIGKYPATPKADKDHYWSYWHDTSGSWTYSTVGASGWAPKAGSVEGWSYVNGTARTPPARAAKGLYKAVCGARDTPSRTTTPKPKASTATVRRSTAAARPGSVARTPDNRSAGAAATETATTTATTTNAATTAPSGSPSDATTSADPAAVPDASPSLPLVVDAKPASATPKAKADSGSVLPLVLVAGLVVVLGGGAGLTVLRRRRADAEL